MKVCRSQYPTGIKKPVQSPFSSGHEFESIHKCLYQILFQLKHWHVCEIRSVSYSKGPLQLLSKLKYFLVSNKPTQKVMVLYCILTIWNHDFTASCHHWITVNKKIKPLCTLFTFKLTGSVHLPEKNNSQLYYITVTWYFASTLRAVQMVSESAYI